MLSIYWCRLLLAHCQLSEKIYKSLDSVTRLLRFTLPFPMFAYPFYLVTLIASSLLPRFAFLWYIYASVRICQHFWLLGIWSGQWGRSPGKKGSHFNPNSDLFSRNERKDIITSTACWVAMVALLGSLSFVMGPVQLLKLYGIPSLVSCLPISDRTWESFKPSHIIFRFLFLLSMITQTHVKITDIRGMVGCGNLLASSWARWEAAMVPRSGKRWDNSLVWPRTNLLPFLTPGKWCTTTQKLQSAIVQQYIRFLTCIRFRLHSFSVICSEHVDSLSGCFFM